MGRVIGEHKIKQMQAAREQDPDALGPLLGEFLIKSNVPVEAAAELIKVSPPTVYRWMYGESKPSAVYTPYINKLLTILRKATRAKQLPLSGTTPARMRQTAALVKEHRPPISRT